MAQVYRNVDGQKIEKWLAKTPGVQHALTTHQMVIASKARRLLAAHRYEGIARIETGRGRIDRYVILADSSASNQSRQFSRGGQFSNSAMSIEFGRKPGWRKYRNRYGEEARYYDKGMQGLFILSRASGLRKG